MDVIAFVGPSGTGKSHRALLVAHQHQADTIRLRYRLSKVPRRSIRTATGTGLQSRQEPRLPPGD